VTNLLYLIPLALFLGGLGLAAFVWSLRSGQYDDLDGAAHRILSDDEDADTATPTSLLPLAGGRRTLDQSRRRPPRHRRTGEERRGLVEPDEGVEQPRQ
jgi:cbb3-type cytochrome oxidase maturation protein